MFRGTVINNTPSFKPRPAQIDGYHKFHVGNFDLFASERMLEELVTDAILESPNETIGKLIGRAFRDRNGFYTILTDSFQALFAKTSPGWAETTLEDELYMKEMLQTEFPTQDFMGWWHSHTFGFHRYSGTDFQNQSAWKQAYQVGLLVVCPEQGDLAFIHAFRGSEAERMRNPYKTQKSKRPRLPGLVLSAATSS